MPWFWPSDGAFATEDSGPPGENERYLPSVENPGLTEELEAEVQAPPTTVLRRAFSRGGPFAAFGNREFALLWSGAFLSNLGTLIHMTVLMWYVKEVMHANRWVAAVYFAGFAPIIVFVLWAGALADKLDRRRLIMVTQGVMASAALALALATTLGWTRSSVWVVMAPTLALGTGFAFTFPAWRAFVPDIVSRRDLMNAIALDSAGFNMARFLGPTLGSVVLALWTAAGAFYINAASFLAVIAALLFIKPRPHARVTEGSVRSHMIEGIRYLRGHPWVVKMLAILLISTFFGLSYVVLLPSFAKDVLHGGAWAYGALLGATGLGASAGAPLVTLLSGRYLEREIIKAALLAYAFALLLLAASPWLWLSVAASFFIGATFLMVSASMVTVLQGRTERGMRGRVMSFYILVFQGTAPVGGLALGFISDRTTTPTAMYAGAGVVLALALVVLAVPSVTRDAVSGTTLARSRGTRARERVQAAARAGRRW